jgi:membrane protease subunit HflC
VVDPETFLRSAGTLDAAEARLNERVAAALSHAFGSRDLASLASVDPKVWSLDTLTGELVGAVAPGARQELGVEVVDIRLRRFNHPIEVRPSVFDLIRSERRQVAATLRAEGEAQYQVVTSGADRERDAILSKADADAERIKGQAEAEAMRILNEAHARDPKFYEFVRTLETYRSVLDDRATVILSSASPLLKLLTHGPDGDLMREPATTPAADGTPSQANTSISSPSPLEGENRVGGERGRTSTKAGAERAGPGVPPALATPHPNPPPQGGRGPEGPTNPGGDRP